MNRFLTIPDDLSQLAPWLESELLGNHLRQLSEEMCVVLKRPFRMAPDQEVEQWLGNDASLVSQQGLQALRPEKINQLLTKPELLLPFQEWVMTYGESYWQQKMQAGVQHDSLSAGKNRFLQALPASTPTQPLGLMAQSNTNRRTWAWVSMLTTAALVLLAAGFLFMQPDQPQVTWGWNEPNLFQGQPTPKAYLEQLASSSEIWFKKRPETAADVSKRIREMQMGCDRLIAHDHPPLNATQKTWLVEKCKAWRDKFSAQLTAVESGISPLTVRQAMDDIVNQLAGKLREEAGKV
jgi:hypothetical protein